MALKDAIKNGRLAYPNRLVNISNAPDGTRPRDSNIEPISSIYYEEVGRFASNVFDAEVQGLNQEDWYEWTTVRLRSSDVINPTTGDHLDNTWQKILILDRDIDYIPIGAYVKYNNAVWIVYNPSNIAATNATAIVARCNTTYNQFDWYNNVIRTPMVVSKGLVLAGSPYYSEYMALPSGYTHAILQYNPDTENVADNTRCILGNTAYGFYGVVNFANEFTMDDSSCHIIRADIRTTEVVPDDDLTNHIAEGKNKTFTITIAGQTLMSVGERQKLYVHAFKNGDEVVDTLEHRVTFSMYVENNGIASISEDGTVVSMAPGMTNVKAVLNQNPDIYAIFKITVVEAETPDERIEWVSPVPETLQVFDAIKLKAVHIVNGVRTDDPVYFSFTGVNQNAYSAEVDGNTASITAYVADNNPLVVTAYCGDISIQSKIQIVGF